MHQPHPDWLYHHLIVHGTAADREAFRRAAAGTGTIPWRLDFDRLQEDWFHLLAQGDETGRMPDGRAMAARVLAEQLRDAAALRHGRAMSRPATRACPLDLHVLVPVPAHVLHLGPDDASALAWLWDNWGTTWPLRHVRTLPSPEQEATVLGFWSADWTPWRALATIAAAWGTLRFEIRPRYDAA